MKNNFFIAVCVMTVGMALNACGSSTASETATTESRVEYIALEDSEVTVPKLYVDEEVAQDNVASVDDTSGDVTYSLTGSERTEMVSELIDEIDASIATVLADKEYYPDIESITYNNDCTEFTINLTGSTANMYESMLCFSFYTVGNRYQIYTGTDADSALTTVIYVNSATGETVASADSSSLSN